MFPLRSRHFVWDRTHKCCSMIWRKEACGAEKCLRYHFYVFSYWNCKLIIPSSSSPLKIGICPYRPPHHVFSYEIDQTKFNVLLWKSAYVCPDRPAYYVFMFFLHVWNWSNQTQLSSLKICISCKIAPFFVLVIWILISLEKSASNANIFQDIRFVLWNLSNQMQCPSLKIVVFIQIAAPRGTTASLRKFV